MVKRPKIWLFCLLIIGLLVFPGCACTNIEPGNVGIVVNYMGTEKGVDETPVYTGTVFFNGFTQRVFEYPVHLQRENWTKALGDGGADEAIQFNSQEGVVIDTDVSLHYMLRREKVPKIFQTLRGDKSAVREYLRNLTRDVIGKEASHMSVSEIYGDKKVELLDNAKKRLIEQVGGDFDIQFLAFIGAPRVPDNVQRSSNATIEAQQLAISAKNKVEQPKAEAEQAEEKAKGEARAIETLAESRAKANRTLSESLTPELVAYEALQRWNGRLPMVSGSGATPFIQVPAQELDESKDGDKPKSR